ncbi:Putative bacterial virulence factor [Serratia marcescens]|uniref:virulence factor SrfC family protein n=1 Tax=Serratia marcescens TaxID=615 RepID=UPI00217AD2FA|nr:virulence factor SrfC family protein [Serratia marcescens]CAI1096082.1 Putative bacterial virulence factor [Serratia marcescens]CAI1096460.1 Putative bacterial virulence factor [Serratia marcescens]CAI1946706.1 Putative bacterial virulence factor [Serratia marcescens]CAI1948174.1 Putative bacterial virulence factor [Serratia marcescens]
MNTQTFAPAAPNNALSAGILQAIDWVDAARRQSPRLEREADRLIQRLRRCHNRAARLENTCPAQVAIGLYGHNAAAKAHLLAALAPGAKRFNADLSLAVRYCTAAEAGPAEYPIALALLNEAQWLAITLDAAAMGGFRLDWDARAIAGHLQTLARHRQAIAPDGLSDGDVLALWDSQRRHGDKGQQTLDRHFWPQAVALAPQLSIDDRARLFAPLWGEEPTLTTHYRQLAYTLHALGGSRQVHAPRRALTLLTASATAENTAIVVMAEHGGEREIALSDLVWLTAEVTTVLPQTAQAGLPADVALIDLPGSCARPQAEPTQRLQQAKRAHLLARCADGLHANLLLVADAAATPQDAARIGQALAGWVDHTQGETPALRQRRKPGLIWAITPFDPRQEGKPRPDDAVQRQVGEPGDNWATLLALDEQDCRRMVNYLAAQARPAHKQARLLELREELQRELTESLLGNWLTAADPYATQQRAQQLLRALQAQAGRHGELLERLLPQRDTLRQLYQQQQHAAPTPATPAPFGLDIDLFGAPETPASGEPPTSPFAARIFADWINHLRSLPDSRRLLDLLGVDKPHLELLVDALIGAACRQRLDDELERALCAGGLPEQGEDRQISQALALLGDFVAWLGFQRRDAATRPESRVNPGQPIFTPPPQPAVDWSGQQRLTRLAPTPTKNTAFYIYDWLIGLQTLLAENAAMDSALGEAQRAELEEIVAALR